MPDITAVLERAAATPTRAPDVEGAVQRARRRRAGKRAAAAVVASAIVVGVVAANASGPRRVRVMSEPPPTSVQQSATSATSHDAEISVAPGWSTSSEPLAWWLTSPFELFSIATAPIPPSPHKQPNEAACPSEIPQVAVDNLPADGAYLWVGEWVPKEGIYQSVPRPSTFSLETNPAPRACDLPRGERAFSSVFHDASSGRDFAITYVLGRDAPPRRLADIDQMLDSLSFSGASPTR